MTVELQREDDSIRLAVERETRRRKKALMGFLALLVIPIAIGGWVLVRAPKETELVVREVTPIVQQRVGENVTKQVVEQSATLIERTVEEKVAPIRAVRDEVKTLTSEVARMQPVLAQNVRNVESVRLHVAKLPQGGVQRIIDKPAPDRQLAAMQAQLNSQQAQIQEIIDRLTAVEKRLPTPR